MSPEFDVGQEVAASLSSRRGAWRFIRRYAEAENQSVAVWGVPLAAMAQADPPVVARNFEDGGWEPFLERFSVACVALVLSESLHSALVSLSDNRELDPAEVALVAQRFARLAIPDYPMWALPGGSVRWFVGPEVLLCDFVGTWLWVRARTTGGLDAVRVALPGEWLMCPNVGAPGRRRASTESQLDQDEATSGARMKEQQRPAIPLGRVRAGAVMG
jgi:hypothetical protein